MVTAQEAISNAMNIYNNRDKYCYFYGAKGEVMTDAKMTSLINAQPNYFAKYTATDLANIKNYSRGKIGFDCSGFITKCTGAPGGSANQINNCTDKGTNLAAGPAGSFLWKQGHIGLDIGSGNFLHFPVEGRTCELVRIQDYNWTHTGKSKYVTFEPVVTSEGYLDEANQFNASGWAWNGIDDTVLDVHVYLDRYVNGSWTIFDLQSTKAKIYRADLKNAGKGSGKHGFEVAFNLAGFINDKFRVRAYAIVNNNPMLTGAPKEFVVQNIQAEGNLEKATQTGASGWAWNGLNDRILDVHIGIERYVGGKWESFDLKSVKANVYREDLKNAGKGSGKHAFSIAYDLSGYVGSKFRIRANAISGSNPEIYNSPKQFTVK